MASRWPRSDAAGKAMSGILEFSYRSREWISSGPALAIFLVVASFSVTTVVQQKKSRNDTSIAVSLAELPSPAPMEPPRPAPRLQSQPNPQRVVEPERPRTPEPMQQHKPEVSVPSSAVAAPMSTSPVREAPAVATPAIAEAPRATQTDARPVPAPAVQVPPPAPGASAEAGYIGKVRSYLNSIKRYPTGREASLQRPRGKTRIWFVLTRNGTLVESGIDESSQSLLLDGAAHATVRRGTFPPFPEDAWGGQSSHRFVVELEFAPVS